MVLNPSTIEAVLDLYAQDTEPHTSYGEAAYDSFMYTFPLANRLRQLYAERSLLEDHIIIPTVRLIPTHFFSISRH